MEMDAKALQIPPTRGCSSFILRNVTVTLLLASSLEHVTSVHPAGKSRAGEHVPGSQQGSFYSPHSSITLTMEAKPCRLPSHPSGGEFFTLCMSRLMKYWLVSIYGEEVVGL